MSVFSSLFKTLSRRQNCLFNKPGFAVCCPNSPLQRSYADKIKKEISKSKHNIVVQGTENEERMRVRRALPADVPRVLRFVRQNARTFWPSLTHITNSSSASHLILSDYVARALSQGHSMLAEQQESRRGWTRVRGVALGLSVCPWDASMLEQWARCIKCTRSRRLVYLTAHCLRTPALHDKYGVQNILQVILLVPHDCPKNKEIIHILTKNAIQRGRDVGYSVLRFDVTDKSMSNALEELNLTKEWELSYDVLPEVLKEAFPLNETLKPKQAETKPEVLNKPQGMTVYSAVTTNDKQRKT